MAKEISLSKLSKKNNKTIVVTVGTTLFEKLVELVTTAESLEWMQLHNYTQLIVQYGKGAKPNLDMAHIQTKYHLSVELYDFKPSLAADMSKADLILSHAGAGTISEVLRLPTRPRLVVVVNTLLMDNHQLELAHAMQRRNHLYVVESPQLLSQKTVWNDFEYNFEPRPLDPTDETSFARILWNFFQIPPSINNSN